MNLRPMFLAASACVALSAACSSQVEDEPGLAGSASSAAEKRVVVSLQEQRARAYEGTTCVREWPVSTGSVGNETWLPYCGKSCTPKETLEFPILEKKSVLFMTDPTGQGRYTNEEVHWNVRLTAGGIHFHQANWSNITGASTDCGHCGYVGSAPYGTSHGCVNQRSADARWFYDWAPTPSATKKVVRLSFDAFAPEACAHVTPSAEDFNAGEATNASHVVAISYDQCLAHPTHCLEDLKNRQDEWNGRWICWKDGSTSSTGAKECVSGKWVEKAP